MQQIEFCAGCKCAKLKILKSDKTFLSKNLPLVLEFGQEEETFVHDMTAPIQRSFPFEIGGIQFVEGKWYFNNPSSDTLVDCPMPGTYPVLKAPDAKREAITDMYWRGNELLCFFDMPGVYGNNHGQCTYKVLSKNNKYTFSDSRGILYQEKAIVAYTVECDACCKDNEILCDSHFYPGYKCYPIPPTAGRLLKGQNEIARYWRYRG